MLCEQLANNPLTVSNRDSVAHLRNIDPYKNFSIIRHGSSSCDEEQLGQPEQPSDTQCRASHLTPETDIRSYDSQNRGQCERWGRNSGYEQSDQIKIGRGEVGESDVVKRQHIAVAEVENGVEAYLSGNGLNGCQVEHSRHAGQVDPVLALIEVIDDVVAVAVGEDENILTGLAGEVVVAAEPLQSIIAAEPLQSVIFRCPTSKLFPVSATPSTSSTLIENVSS